MADAAPCQREYGDRKMRSLHGGIEVVLLVELRDFGGHGIFSNSLALFVFRSYGKLTHDREFFKVATN